jgi:hypothetical protein
VLAHGLEDQPTTRPEGTWAEHGEALLRRRKPWYYEHAPRPDISVLGARLSELLRSR